METEESSERGEEKEKEEEEEEEEKDRHRLILTALRAILSLWCLLIDLFQKTENDSFLPCATTTWIQ